MAARIMTDLHHLIQNSQQEPPPEKAPPLPWVVDGKLRDIPDAEWEALTRDQRMDYYRECAPLLKARWESGNNPGYVADKWRGLP